METQIFYSLPPHFSPVFKAVGCFCIYRNTLLLLKRHAKSTQGNCWGIPAGKIEKEEEEKEAAKRELWEETGLIIHPLERLERVYVRQSHQEYTFMLFRGILEEKPSLNLASLECTEARWVTIDEALKLPLIGGGTELLHFYKDSFYQ